MVTCPKCGNSFQEGPKYKEGGLCDSCAKKETAKKVGGGLLAVLKALLKGIGKVCSGLSKAMSDMAMGR